MWLTMADLGHGVLQVSPWKQWAGDLLADIALLMSNLDLISTVLRGNDTIR